MIKTREGSPLSLTWTKQGPATIRPKVGLNVTCPFDIGFHLDMSYCYAMTSDPEPFVITTLGLFYHQRSLSHRTTTITISIRSLVVWWTPMFLM